MLMIPLLYVKTELDGFTSPPTQYRLYGRRFLQVKRPTNIDGDHETCFIRPTRSRQKKLHIYVNKSLQE